ncbi:MAG: TauD/TfdA family dioxygenase [Myxococcota bacterium]
MPRELRRDRRAQERDPWARRQAPRRLSGRSASPRAHASRSGRRSLYMTDRGVMHRLVDLPASESDAILDFLDRHVAEPRFQVRWRWQPGQLAIWDERTTLHRGVSDHFPQRRAIRRCTVDGEKPFFDPDRRPDPSYARD